MRKANFCVVVPAYNEEVVIENSLQALKRVVPKRHIYVVSDGSHDKTALLAKRSGVNVMALRKNAGKAMALKKLMDTRHLMERYKYILFSDADSRLVKDFVKQLQPYLLSNPACIVGTVTSQRYGFISAFRTFEYGLSHMLYKQAQSHMGLITVAPGCASIYRSDVLRNLDFSNHTLTEDYDLTIQIHNQKLGQIKYAPKAVVYTQDPQTIKDYWKQIQRWHTGYWQIFFLHKMYKPNKLINMENYLLLLDSVVGIAALLSLFFRPDIAVPILISFYFTYVGVSIVTLLILRQYWSVLYTPLFVGLYFINIASYLYSVPRALFSKSLSWNKVVRYAS